MSDRSSIKLLIIAGARPNFMKVAPLIKAAEAHNARVGAGGAYLDWRLVHTGQHYDEKMSDIFFRELGIPNPHRNLSIGSGSHAQQTASVMCKFEEVCLEEKPDWVVVVGDVNSTMACTLVSAKMGIKVAHVEAGLRSFDRNMPEEINRLVTDTLADLLLTPSPDANENLIREGVAESKIRLVGNVMIDTLATNLAKAESSPILKNLGLRSKSFAYVTLHRPSNVDDKESLGKIMQHLQKLAEELPIVFPMHPRTRKMLMQFDIFPVSAERFKILEPVGYHESISLTQNARLILTDSGGLQEESTYFKTPCLTLRPNTERPVTITCGSNRLTKLDRLTADFQEILNSGLERGQIPGLWDGQAAIRIMDAILEREQLDRLNRLS
jgi:UDP-N-acetylglucosamine 2-epimerase (non-hydrolysing)